MRRILLLCTGAVTLFGLLFLCAGVESASERGREIALLVEGAISLMLIHGDRRYAESAAGAAKRLFNGKQ